MYQSVRANHAVTIANKLAEKNARISEEALALSQRIEESKGKISLRTEVSSTFPQTLTFTPLSPEVAISSSKIGYIAAGTFHDGRKTGSVKPGLHDLTQIGMAIDDELAAKVKANEALGEKTEKMGSETFPLLLTVEYVFQGRSRTSSLIYGIDVNYNPERPMLSSDQQNLAIQKGCVPFGDIHLIRDSDNDPSPDALANLYSGWRRQRGLARLDDK